MVLAVDPLKVLPATTPNPLFANVKKLVVLAVKFEISDEPSNNILFKLIAVVNLLAEAALPNVFAALLGISAATRLLKPAAPEVPEAGPAKIVFGLLFPAKPIIVYAGIFNTLPVILATPLFPILVTLFTVFE